MGFNGFVVSDWESVTLMVTHGFTEKAKEAAFRAVTAGVDMELASTFYKTYLTELIKEGCIFTWI